MPDTNGTPSDAELLKAAVQWAMKRVRVHLPATVEEVHLDDAGHVRTVDVRVDVGEYVRGLEGEVAEYEPILPNVAVEWPGGGGARLTFPLARGDLGLLLFCDRSLDEWQANPTGQVVARDKRTHHLNDAVFAPGLRRPAAPWTGARTDAVTLGYEAGAGGQEGMQLHITPTVMALGAKDPAYAVALAEKVKTELESLRSTVATLVTTFNAHSHLVTTAGTASAQTGTAAPIGENVPPTPPVPAPPVVQDMGSTTVKVKE